MPSLEVEIEMVTPTNSDPAGTNANFTFQIIRILARTASIITDSFKKRLISNFKIQDQVKLK